MEKGHVLITGASTGIGEACALDLDKRGFPVFAGVRQVEDAKRLASQTSDRFVPVTIDVTHAESIADAAKQIGDRVGEQGLAGLVNNAGIAVAGPLELMPLEKIREQLEVNVVGQIAVTQAFLPLLRKATGRIVNMGSVSGRIASPYLGSYAVSKFAMEAVTDSLRVELRRWAISVSIIEPGSIKTPIWRKSRAMAENLAERMDAPMEALYHDDLEKFRAKAEVVAAKAIPVDHVVRAVVHALTARRPKTRYPVGLDARIGISLLKFLPDRIRDRILMKELGL